MDEDDTLRDNYQPTSLLSIYNRLFEKTNALQTYYVCQRLQHSLRSAIRLLQ